MPLLYIYSLSHSALPTITHDRAYQVTFFEKRSQEIGERGVKKKKKRRAGSELGNIVKKIKSGRKDLSTQRKYSRRPSLLLYFIS